MSEQFDIAKEDTSVSAQGTLVFHKFARQTVGYRITERRTNSGNHTSRIRNDPSKRGRTSDRPRSARWDRYLSEQAGLYLAQGGGTEIRVKVWPAGRIPLAERRRC